MNFQAVIHKTESEWDNNQPFKTKDGFSSKSAAEKYAKEQIKTGKYFCIRTEDREDLNDISQMKVFYKSKNKNMPAKKKSQLQRLKERLKGLSLDELLEEISVLGPDQWDNKQSDALEGWFAVATDAGIIAYFGDEQDALGFRLDLINSILNK